MPDQTRRPKNQPDPAESRERADPEKEAGLGKLTETRNTPVPDPEQHNDARKQREQHREIAADETTDHSQAIKPTDPAAHGGRSERSENEATNRRQRD